MCGLTISNTPGFLPITSDPDIPYRRKSSSHSFLLNHTDVHAMSRSSEFIWTASALSRQAGTAGCTAVGSSNTLEYECYDLINPDTVAPTTDRRELRINGTPSGDYGDVDTYINEGCKPISDRFGVHVPTLEPNGPANPDEEMTAYLYVPQWQFYDEDEGDVWAGDIPMQYPVYLISVNGLPAAKIPFNGNSADLPIVYASGYVCDNEVRLWDKLIPPDEYFTYGWGDNASLFTGWNEDSGTITRFQMNQNWTGDVTHFMDNIVVVINPTNQNVNFEASIFCSRYWGASSTLGPCTFSPDMIAAATQEIQIEGTLPARNQSFSITSYDPQPLQAFPPIGGPDFTLPDLGNISLKISGSF